MARYAAFLRGVMPFNCKMAELRGALLAAGFDNVVTVLGSGNAVFDARKQEPAALERKCEAAMAEHMGRSFVTFVRSIAALEALLATDPYKGKVPAAAKRNVTFLRREPATRIKPANHHDMAWLVGQRGREVFSAYLPGNPNGTEFMAMIEKALGKEQTTRTWQTVEKVARA